MTGAKSLMAAWVVAASTMLSTAALADDLELPAGARIGIIDMASTDVTHYHVGKVPTNSFMRQYRVAWSIADLVEDPLANQLRSAGFEPVFLGPSTQLHRQRRSWIVTSPNEVSLPRAAMEEVSNILTAENLQALIIIAPGQNSNPEAVAGNRLRRIPAYVQGWGFSTSDEDGGIETPVVFNLTQMLLIGTVRNSVELAFREWGGGFVYEWSNFAPSEDMKTLPPQEIDKFMPIIKDVVQRQVSRLMPHIKVAG